MVNCGLERARIGEGLMCKVVHLEVVPDPLDVVQFRRVLGQPLDGEPVGAGGKRSLRQLADVDWAIVLDQHHWCDRLSRLWSVEPVQLFKMGDEVAAALAAAGMDDQLAREMVE